LVKVYLLLNELFLLSVLDFDTVWDMSVLLMYWLFVLTMLQYNRLFTTKVLMTYSMTIHLVGYLLAFSIPGCYNSDALLLEQELLIDIIAAVLTFTNWCRCWYRLPLYRTASKSENIVNSYFIR